MTEQAVNQDQQPQQQPVGQLPHMTPEQLQHVRDALLQKLMGHYRQFIESIRSFPANQEIVKDALKHFDTGFLWYEVAIKNMPVDLKLVPVSPQQGEPQPPQAPSQPSEPQAQEESKEGIAVGEYNPQDPNAVPQTQG